MQHQSGIREGYFAWSCKTDGTHNAEGAASDGELYFITSLLFASNRWGNDTGINYKAEAQRILDCSMPKEYEPEQQPGFGGFGQQPGPQKMYLIDPETHLITFTPDGFGNRFTDPSYHIPAFYEVWAKYADDGRADLWLDCAAKSRAYLHKVTHPVTGLNPDMSSYDGQVMQMPGGRRFGTENFRYDSWRVPMNITLDYVWSGADSEWQEQYGERIQNFFYTQGLNDFVDQYRIDGSLPEESEILPAGDYPKKLRHSIGLVATTAAASILCHHDKRKEFVDALWNARHEPFEDGYFDAYYDGLLRLFAFMHLSGHYRLIEPAPKSRIIEDGGTGPYKVVMTEVEGLAEHTVFVPQDLSVFDADHQLPVLVWGNGACANSPWEHMNFLNEIASHGYLVLATGIIPMEDEWYKGPMSRTEQQIESIDWAYAQNADPQSPYYQKIDVKNLCVAGMSCGGLQTLFNCADPRIKALMICNSGLFKQENAAQAVGGMPMPPKEKLKDIHTPIIYILGGPEDIACENGMDDFHRIDHVPACAINYPVGHGGTYREPHGGEFTIPAQAWLDWQLKGDSEAAKMFVGDDCGLLKRKGWTIEKNARF